MRPLPVVAERLLSVEGRKRDKHLFGCISNGLLLLWSCFFLFSPPPPLIVINEGDAGSLISHPEPLQEDVM